MAMKQPTLASFNDKKSSNDQDGPSSSKLGGNTNKCAPSIPNVHGQKKKKTLFQTLWLSNIWCLKFLYPHFIFCAPNFTDQDVQKTPVKNFSGHTALPEMAFQNIVRNGTNDSNQYFLLFPSCFIPHQNQILSFESHLNCCLQIILIWTSLKF